MESIGNLMENVTSIGNLTNSGDSKEKCKVFSPKIMAKGSCTNSGSLGYIEAGNRCITRLEKISKDLEEMHIQATNFIKPGMEGFGDIKLNTGDVPATSYAHYDGTKIDLKTLFHDSNLDLTTYITENYQEDLPTQTPVIETKLELVIPNLIKPIGVSRLVNGNLVIGQRGYRNTVGIFDSITGNQIRLLKSDRGFENPSDMVSLPDGRFVVRDDLGLQMFDEEGNFIKAITPNGVWGICYGIKCDSDGHLITINTNPNGVVNSITRKGETDILIIDLGENVILEKIELVDVISDPKKSKCRFLECDGEQIYVVDLGINQVYVVNREKTNVKKFGRTGFGPGQFRDAAGIAVDSVGNMIVVDAGNNRLQVFDKRRTFLGFVRFNSKIARPSGIYLDKEAKFLYVLNLKSNSLVKVALIKK